MLETGNQTPTGLDFADATNEYKRNSRHELHPFKQICQH